jgi:transposase
MRTTMGRKSYASDLTDVQWKLLEPIIPQPSLEGRPPHIERREIMNAILYILRSGCPWRLLPHEFPKWQTVYSYFRRWQQKGVWDQILRTLRMQLRTRQGRDPEPSAAVIDSQSIKTSAVRGPEKGIDMGKKNLGPQTELAGG